jgi:hypothetical protein
VPAEGGLPATFAPPLSLLQADSRPITVKHAPATFSLFAFISR